MSEQQQQAPQRLPVELVVHESMIRIGKDLATGGVELRFDTPIGLSVKVAFTEQGWSELIANGQRAVTGLQVARTMPPQPG